jgi:hypothetical protein
MSAKQQGRLQVCPVLAVAALLLGVSAGVAQSGDGYELTWWTVDAGGGTSHGGGYRLSGIAGQPDAGMMGGGGYVLGSGFWRGGTGPTREFRVYLPLSAWMDLTGSCQQPYNPFARPVSERRQLVPVALPRSGRDIDSYETMSEIKVKDEVPPGKRGLWSLLQPANRID